MPLSLTMRTVLLAVRVTGGKPINEMTIPEARRATQARIRRRRKPIPIASIADRTIPGPAGPIPIRLYTPEGPGPFPLVVFFHGGGFVVGNLDNDDMICRSLCHGADCVVVSVDYRLAPEHKFPAAPDDCLAATRWAAEHAVEFNADPARIALAGDSAGGNLAAVTAMRIRDEGGPRLRGQLLIYPMTDYHTPPAPSLVANASDYLVTRDMLRRLKRGALLVDVAIDQGGCFETSRPTTHTEPTYVVDGVVHYCVANMPGAVPRTATQALNHATLPFVQALAGRGVNKALSTDPHLRNGLNVARGQVTEPAVAATHGYDYVDPILALESAWQG